MGQEHVSVLEEGPAAQEERVGTNGLGRKQQSRIESRESLALAGPKKDMSPLGASHDNTDSTIQGKYVGDDSKGVKNKAKIVHKYEVTD